MKALYEDMSMPGHANKVLFKLSKRHWEYMGRHVPFRNFIYLFIFIFRATPMAYGSSWTRGHIRAAAIGLHQSHSNNRSEPHLWPPPQLQQCWILNPLNEARHHTYILMDTSWVLNMLSHNIFETLKDLECPGLDRS